jgi:UDP-N-acetylmuramoyl-tripeptide--D-alanyl-D-alanine ligase
LAALGRLAAHWRSRFALPVFVIVGSNGKTTVKEMLAAILRAHFGEANVLSTEGNLNNAIGLPLTILRLRDSHAAAVVELGMNHPGETAELAVIAQPTVAIVNNAQREHQEFMRSVADVAAEHAAIVRALPASGIAVLNADDPHVDVWRAATRERAGLRVCEFAVDAPCGDPSDRRDCRRRRDDDLRDTPGRCDGATPRARSAQRVECACRPLLRRSPSTFRLAGVVRGLEAFRPVAGRLVPLPALTGASVIDDTYNANPDSVEAAIDVLAAMPSPRWLALGDMGEVGANGPRYHHEIGAYARAAGIDRLLTVGALAVESAAAFGAGAQHFATVEALASHIAEAAAAETTVLVKGSRFMRMERVVAALCGASAREGAH